MKSQCLSESWNLLELLVVKIAVQSDTVCSSTCVVQHWEPWPQSLVKMIQLLIVYTALAENLSSIPCWTAYNCI